MFLLSFQRDLGLNALFSLTHQVGLKLAKYLRLYNNSVKEKCNTRMLQNVTMSSNVWP